MPGSINYRLIFLIFTITATSFFIGCSRDQEPAFVDFSKKMIVNQSPEESPDGSVIRVAVAAMISARESVKWKLYHQRKDAPDQIPPIDARGLREANEPSITASAGITSR